MAKYRKKPVVVEAEQFFEDRKPWPEGVIMDPLIHDRAFVVTDHDERATVVDGDWIITEPDGVHHYPCKPDVFEESYEITWEEEESAPDERSGAEPLQLRGTSGLAVSRDVHYVARGSADGKYKGGAHRAAKVTEVHDKDRGIVALCVINPEGIFFPKPVVHDERYKRPGTWHWPEHVE